MNNEPIKSQQEADQVKKYLIDFTMKEFSVSKAEATKRIDFLLKSGVLDGGSPQDPVTQMRIIAFLSIDSSTYAHLKV